ncbi:MAG TPA: HXXEE domain-containing protein [Gemmatimonadales bacterium]|nr:HXXEE domain-containing protein [Gemmatimonadales bacterium]
MPPRPVLWLVPILLALHNTEEALFFPRYLPFVLYRLPAAWQALIAPLTTGQVGGALAVVTGVAFIVTWWAFQRPDSAVALWLVLLIQATVLLNALWHLAAAVVLFGGYAPGLVTALLLNLPFSVYLLRRAGRERWLERRALWALAPAAIVLHGPLLAALLVFTERWPR